VESTPVGLCRQARAGENQSLSREPADYSSRKYKRTSCYENYCLTPILETPFFESFNVMRVCQVWPECSCDRRDPHPQWLTSQIVVQRRDMTAQNDLLTLLAATDYDQVNLNEASRVRSYGFCNCFQRRTINRSPSSMNSGSVPL